MSYAPGPMRHARRVAASEFGGPWPLLAAVVALPAVVYYLWISLEYYAGALPLPASAAPADVVTFVRRMIGHVVSGAGPTRTAIVIYAVWVGWQVLLAAIGPGPKGPGPVLPDGTSRLEYRYNGLFAWYATLAAVAVLHWSGLFPLGDLSRHFGSLLTVVTLAATALAVGCYVAARRSDRDEGATGNVVYDFFMGAVLNPRIRDFDVKFFVELRPGIMLWFFFTLSMLVRQYDATGTVTNTMLLVAFYHLCYANACFKGEECVPMSMDIATERFGWMLAWGNLVWVPFVYCLPAYYLLVSGYDVSAPVALLLLLVHAAAYYVFDTANSQKDYFRAGRELRRGFPWLPGGRLVEPEALPTATGRGLLVSGWWGVARHINYLGDIVMAWTWAVTCGFGSVVPYVYPVFLTSLLLHRERRDERFCRAKYGADWDAYCRRVRHRVAPYIY